jgi:hypothetical protein
LRDVAESLNKSEADVNEYAKKHGLKVK